MAIGLFFFIRASVKDRTTEMHLLAEAAAEEIAPKLQAYFTSRAYQAIETGDRNTLTLEGFVRPSLVLALFLSVLAACGAACLALVLTLAVPATGAWPFGLVAIIAPAAGAFYWRQAGRIERLQLQVEPQSSQSSRVTISAHRDELIALLAEPTLPLQPQPEAD